MILIFIDPNH